MYKRFKRACLLLLFLANPGFPVGQSALPSLTLAVPARYSAMGEAGGAVCFDEGAIHYNPAGLFFVDPRATLPIGAGGDYNVLLPEFRLEDLYHRNFYVYGRYKNWLSLALSNKHVNFGKNEWTDESGRLLGYFESYDNFTILTAAINLETANRPSHYAIGLNFKYIYSKLADVPVGNENRRAIAESFAVDAGFVFKEPWARLFSVGLVLQNMGPPIVYVDHHQADPLPFNIKLAFGAVYTAADLFRLTLAFDLNKEMVRRRDPDPPDPFIVALRTSWLDNSWEVERAEIIRNYGVELLVLDHIALRMGGMVDRLGHRWERTRGVGFVSEYLSVSLASIGEMHHVPYRGSIDPESTARNGQVMYSIGLRYPLCSEK